MLQNFMPNFAMTNGQCTYMIEDLVTKLLQKTVFWHKDSCKALGSLNIAFQKKDKKIRNTSSLI